MRQYQEWNNGIDAKSGILSAKRALNILHGQLAEQGFNQVISIPFCYITLV